MAVNNSVDPATWLAEQIEHGNPDLLRSTDLNVRLGLAPTAR
jgi:hypothetical protein